ncbi:MAG: hypothetical protein NZ578_15300, partial [Candidatus Binatia bacterium]|nr:hypothetical protein [Candidatus Binatia bacterium]
FTLSAYSNTSCAVTTSVVAMLESHDHGQVVSGITAIRGWAFDVRAGSRINTIELLVDGKSYGTIPCCAQRRDVQGAFPAFPADNTLHSGWGTTFNWGILPSGVHTIRVKVHSVAGGPPHTETRTVVVVKPGEFEFLERFDLSTAMVSLAGEELIVRGVRVRDRTTLQEKTIETRFRWSSRSQSFELVGAVTVAHRSSFRSFVASLLPAFPSGVLETPAVPAAQAAAGIIALIESPQAGQVVSGIDVIRGWAFPETREARPEEIQLLLDGQPMSTIPCCAERRDVAAVFPQYPNALQSGWGVAFNYGLLPSGLHTISVRVRDSLGTVHMLERRVEVVRPGGFEFLDRFDLSAATVYRDGEDIVIQGVWVRDQSSRQEKNIDVRVRWLPSSQSLGIVSATG